LDCNRPESALAELDRRNRRRVRHVLDSPQGASVREGGDTLVNFSSNDYLGLADHPRLREAAIEAIARYGVGAGASPLVSGHMRAHEEAELAFAGFAGFPRALLFSSGYAANLGILSTLAGRGAEIFADRLNHACLNDGAVLSRARFTRYRHGDPGALATALERSSAQVRVVATDAVFSMDGDIAPLAEIAALCQRYDAWLVVDDAHGIGVLGRGGRGTVDALGVRYPRLVYMATLGKALGGYGAFAAADAPVVEWLLQRARTYVYSTALPPMVAAAASAAIALLDREPSIVERLHERIAQFRRACAERMIALKDSVTAIQACIVGDDGRALAIAERLHAAGYRVPAIRPPTVPEGTARLRISLSAAHSPDQIDAVAAALAQALQ
jgi:8-amino-7-oxononanoate synthase